MALCFSFFIYMYDHHFRPRSAQKEKIRI